MTPSDIREHYEERLAIMAEEAPPEIPATAYHWAAIRSTADALGISGEEVLAAVAHLDEAKGVW